jgi:hypothetical protein|tara:strand:- start:3264 stop:3527 length:264 start_codon:yes stop_codon:yes gene_type:complete
MKSLFIRCSEETYELAHSLAKKENRSLNKQIIHMIHSEADNKNISIEEDQAEQDGKAIYSGAITSENYESKLGLRGIAETKKQDSYD